MNADFVNLLLILVYLIFGTLGIALLAGWALKHFDRQHEPRHTIRPVSNGGGARKTRPGNRDWSRSD